MAKRFVVPFAATGDKSTTPDATDPTGLVSYSQGWGADYQKANSEVGYKPVGRQEMNGLFNDVTGAIAEIQTLGYPEWVAVSGLVTPYAINAVVRHSAVVWRSLVDNNSQEPTASATQWISMSQLPAQSYGLGLSGTQAATAITDLNAATTSGTFRFAAAATNKPFTNAGLLRVSKGAAATLVQEAFADSGALSWVRSSTDNGTNWSAWTQSASAGQTTGRVIGVQVFTASGTYTPTPGTNSVIVEGVGGGGASGGIPATTAAQGSAGAGASAGAYGKGRFTTGFSGATVTVGAAGAAGSSDGGNGGATSFGALMSLPGGLGSGAAQALSTFPAISGTNPTVSAAPSGANLGGGPGQAGGNGIALSSGASGQFSGAGGSTVFGSGGWSRVANGAGSPASGYGAGGGGGVNNASQAAKLGSAGTPGILIIMEYA